MACSTCNKTKATKQTTVVKKPTVKIYSINDLKKLKFN
jgi:hypothetical protein